MVTYVYGIHYSIIHMIDITPSYAVNNIHFFYQKTSDVPCECDSLTTYSNLYSP